MQKTRTERLTPDEPPFTPAELSKYLNMPLGTLADMRYRGVGPRWVKCGKLVRYPRAFVAEYLAANEHQKSGEATQAAVRP